MRATSNSISISFFSECSKSLKVVCESPLLVKADPIAAKRCEFSGIIACSSSRWRVRTKALRSCGKK